jgi:hypothetical protein
MPTPPTHETSASTPNALGAELFRTRRNPRGGRWFGWGIAIAAHALAAHWAMSAKPAAMRSLGSLEIELPTPEPPAPPPPPPVAKDEPEPAHAVAAPARAAAAAAPAPARAAALVTAKADPTPSPAADEPVDFTNDPSVIGFGSGVVAVGGTARVGLAQARPAPASGLTSGAGPKPAGDALVPLGDLSRKPGLGESDPCRGYFPSTATDDVASAAVMVTIEKSGAVGSVQLLSESPPKQGFGAAARTCMAAKRFTPGLDRDGNPARTAVRVNIRFLR